MWPQQDDVRQCKNKPVHGEGEQQQCQEKVSEWMMSKQNCTEFKKEQEVE